MAAAPEDPLAARRSRAASIAAHVKWSKTDPVAGTAKARQAFLDSFVEQVDPDRVLPEAERARRAGSARRAHFLRLAARSVQSRAPRKAGGGDAA